MTFVTSTGTENITTTIYLGTQIEFSSSDNENNKHAIYSSHSDVPVKNKLAVSVWNELDDYEISKNLVLEINGANEINIVDILPLSNNSYDIGKETKLWKLMTGSRLYTDTLQSKILSLYSGE